MDPSNCPRNLKNLEPGANPVTNYFLLSSSMTEAQNQRPRMTLTWDWYVQQRSVHQLARSSGRVGAFDIICFTFATMKRIDVHYCQVWNIHSILRNGKVISQQVQSILPRNYYDRPDPYKVVTCTITKIHREGIEAACTTSSFTFVYDKPYV